MLATEIYQVRNNLGSEIMKYFLHLVQKTYSQRYDGTLKKQKCTLGQKVYFLLSPKYGNWSLAKN